MWKKYTYLFLMLLFSIAGHAQKTDGNTIKRYWESQDLKGEYPYVNFIVSLDQKPVEAYLYYKKGTRFVLAFIEAVTDSVKERYYENDILFEKINENLKNLIKLSTAGHNREDYLKAMEDPLIPFNNIAIRFKGLHYNHYNPATKEQLATIKNERLVAAYGVLDFIKAFFREQIPASNGN